MATKKVPVAVLIGYFQQMLKDRWKYQMGKAERGTVDCAGAFVWALKQQGISIYHGSNRMARVEVEQLLPVSGTVIVPGMVAFKHRKPGEQGYALPDGYKQGGSHYNGDLNDYYHVGLIDENTARVLNAQSASTGFVESPIEQNWSHVAFLKQVDYSEYYQPGTDVSPDLPVYDGDHGAATESDAREALGATATVYAENGNPVKMRSKPSTSCTLWWPVPHGAVVTVRGAQSGAWVPIAYGGHNGYMMAEFLRTGESGATAVPDTSSDDPGTSYMLTLYDLPKQEAERLAALYPNNAPQITETHG